MTQKGPRYWVTFTRIMKAKTFGIVCLSPGFGGLEMNTLRLVQWMQELGWRVPLLLRDGTTLCQRAVDAGYEVTKLPKGKLIFGAAKCLSSWVQKSNVSTLLFPFRKDLKVAAFYKYYYNRKIKIIYQQHMQVGLNKRDPLHTLRYNAVDAWISPLEYLKAETLEKTRVPESKISVLPFGIDLVAFNNTKWNKASARTALALPEAPEIIGVLGRIDPKKGQDLVIKAIHQLHQNSSKDYQLLLLGDATLNEGDEFSRILKNLVLDLGLEQKIHFRTYQPDILQFYRAIDLFAMPSHGETYGMVTLEAMAAGVPVIGTNRDGTKEILKDGELGYLFEKDDVADFCRQVKHLEQNKNLPQLLQQAKEEVTNNYSKEEMCRRMEVLILKL